MGSVDSIGRAARVECVVRICVWNVGPFLLRLVESADELAANVVGVGRPVPDSHDLVGTVDLPCRDCDVVCHVGIVGAALPTRGDLHHLKLNRFCVRCRLGAGSLHAAGHCERHRDAQQLLTWGVLVVVVLAGLLADGRRVRLDGMAYQQRNEIAFNSRSNGASELTRLTPGDSIRVPCRSSSSADPSDLKVVPMGDVASVWGASRKLPKHTHR